RLTAERDEYKRKYTLICDTTEYRECCDLRVKAEAERDALKDENQLLQSENLSLAILPHTQTQKLKRLEGELAQARQTAQDNEDKHIGARLLADSTKHACAQLKQQLQFARAREARLRDSIDEAMRYCEKDYGGAVIGK